MVGDDKNRPVFEIQFEGETKHYSPEEISATLLSKMKETAEDFLGQKVKDAIVTVPACNMDDACFTVCSLLLFLHNNAQISTMLSAKRRKMLARLLG